MTLIFTQGEPVLLQDKPERETIIIISDENNYNEPRTHATTK